MLKGKMGLIMTVTSIRICGSSEDPSEIYGYFETKKCGKITPISMF